MPTLPLALALWPLPLAFGGSVVENCRKRDGRVVQRQVLYLGKINDSQRAAWCKSIEVLPGDLRAVPMALFADDREAPELDRETVRINVRRRSRSASAPHGAAGYLPRPAAATTACILRPSRT